MNNSMSKLMEKQHREREEFIHNCPHSDIMVEDGIFGFARTITIRCTRCRLNLAGYTVDGNLSYMSYVRDCVNGHPDSRKSNTSRKDV